MKQVLIRPSFNDWCENRLFEIGTSFNSVYRDAFSDWKRRAAEVGYELNTWDCRPLESADVLWFLDLPDSYREFQKILKQVKPSCRLVLQILETPVLKLHEFHCRNQRHFHSVLRYDVVTDLPMGHFHYRLPNTRLSASENLSFDERKGLLLLNSNRVEGIWARRKPGLSGVPALGKLLSGWKYPASFLLEYLSQERYSYRRKLAKAAELEYQDFVDIMGRGWDGEQVSWAPFVHRKNYKCWREIGKEPKIEICSRYRFIAAIENYQGKRGYISEKIFDALFAGSVPVYLGDGEIQKVIPADAFVDVRDYDSPVTLLRSLSAMHEAEWSRLRTAGANYLQSGAFEEQFGNEQFVQAAMSALIYSMKNEVTSS